MNDNDMSLSAQIELALCTIAAPGKLEQGCKVIEQIVRDWHNAQVDKFVEDTEAHAAQKAQDAETSPSTRTANFREGASYGLSLSAGRALRMKVSE